MIMKKILLFLIIPCLSFSQNSYHNNGDNSSLNPVEILGCTDLDETIIDLVSLFGDTSFLDGLLGCSELIPTLESDILSAFLPFDIPLDCSTDLTPFGYLDMDVSDICECSCQEYLNVYNYNFSNRKIMQKLNILGLETTNKGFIIEIYDDGSVDKKYILN
ncbi:MAG: hypothetical protein CMD26_05405 [Flavobacteriales bacterium]|nr:hypothetical protein [Flavobacteriales bacterium]